MCLWFPPKLHSYLLQLVINDKMLVNKTLTLTTLTAFSQPVSNSYSSLWLIIIPYNTTQYFTATLIKP